MVKSLTARSFSTLEYTDALANAYSKAISVKGSDITLTTETTNDWENYIIPDHAEASVITELAQAILNEGRRTRRSRNENIIVRTVSKLFTEEMKNNLVNAEIQNEEQWDFSNEQPTEHWDVSV